MDNHFIKGNPGYLHQPSGDFQWWPISVWKGKPWPKLVPHLGPGNFFDSGKDTLEHRLDPDVRNLDEWARGFPSCKVPLVQEVLLQSIKERGDSLPFWREIWRWEDRQDPVVRAAIWNRAMVLFGYTEDE